MTDLIIEEGDRIRLAGNWGELEDFTIEKYRFCLGVFTSEEHRKACDFTPLCDLYESGPDSERLYISNYGEYITNKVPMFMQLPKLI